MKIMEFSYDEKQLQTAQNIRESYGERRETDLEKEKVKRPADILAYTLGVIGALILGVGMCICMGVLGASNLFALGIVVGVAGIAVVVANYFIYRAVLNSRKKKYSAEVLALSDKILGR